MISNLAMRASSAILIITIGQQALALEKDTQYWTSQSLSKKIDDQWTALGEIIYRHSVDKGEPVTESFRVGASYKLESEHVLGVLLENRKTDNSNNHEQRLLGQVAKRFKFESVDLSARFRQELRKFASDSELMNRSRILARLDFKNARFAGITPFISEEFYYILNSVGSRAAGTIELRLSLGLSYNFNETFGLEVGYLDRRIFTPKSSNMAAQERLYQVAFVNMRYNF